MTAVLLLQLAAKGSIVLLVTWAITAGMRRASASARHLVWTIGLTATLALPLVPVIGPTWNVTVSRASSLSATSWADREVTTAVDAFVDRDIAPAGSPVSGQKREKGSDREALALLDIMNLLIPLWATGAFFFFARLAYGLLCAGRIARQAIAITDNAWLTIAGEAAAMLRIDRPVKLRQTERSSVPVVCGFWRPSILLPDDALDWPEERRRVVLLHELAHIRRRDCVVQAIAQFTRAVHWINPLAHLALARLHAEQERACDDLVLTCGTDAPDYADHLLDIAKSFRGPSTPAWATLAMARPSQLEGRLMAILDGHVNRAPLAGRARLAYVVAATVALLALGAQRVVVVASDSRSASQSATVTHGAEATSNARPVRSSERGRDQSRDIQAPKAGTAVPTSPTPSNEPSLPVNDQMRRLVADALATALDDENVDVREQALKGLASMRDERAIPALRRALRDPNADLRVRALAALSQFDAPEALDGVIEALADASPDVRRQAIRELFARVRRSRVDASRYTPTFIGLLRSEAPEIRVAAAIVLGQTRDANAVPALTAALKDSDRDVRQRAASALGRIADPSAVEALTAALKDADPAVREHAAIALGRIARGQTRGPARPGVNPPPLPPIPGRPLVSAQIDGRQIAAMAMQATQQALDTVRGLHIDVDLENLDGLETQLEKQLEQLFDPIDRR
jgi:beta-lactamase regulating signal transducer with metallopeptidase domain/HEAT repeat protein